MQVNEILKQREQTHGKFEDYATLNIFLLEGFNEFSVRRLSMSQRSALMMIFSKIARIGVGNPNEADHWRDIAGYATLVADTLE
ncbi:hypothetical protein CPIN18021_0352 [Campylobacter pinnipediorum subsp. caledonicus]|uniref:DUF6378 domain-containing protein n=1 Tax=Campylobacter pinnipediorum subsp. caledonicus TaxID=1874362 RepID=A0A1S6U6W5_9BACT|nr:DUF6378 domain-containing protein [Campylobacter pinnipediorum]AQW85591.1 hypothetical protein CPIN18020_0350 [Campylobacter pinnipediorum subsp. caledonicus]AQW87197.1 hypothetical protein CPIN18021_0352 [Campylobacter pinnipediorum subsp. caledonicus]OPA71871.1 hypothetical protein BB381_06970 [Campylobacter pinnipediorum subsp. caledonicus]